MVGQAHSPSTREAETVGSLEPNQRAPASSDRPCLQKQDGENGRSSVTPPRACSHTKAHLETYSDQLSDARLLRKYEHFSFRT